MRLSRITASSVVFLLSSASIALAEAAAPHGASGHAAAHAEHAPAGIETLIWPAINFVLYLLIFRYLYRKHARPALLARAAGFEEHLRAAAKVLEDAESELNRVEDQYKRIAETQRELRERLATEGAQISAQIIAQAEVNAGGMKRDLARKVARELNAATADVKRQVVARATELAREQIQGKLSEQDDHRLRQDAIKGLF